MYVSSSFGYWDHSVTGIILGLAQSDPIKRRLLYLKNYKITFILKMHNVEVMTILF